MINQTKLNWIMTVLLSSAFLLGLSTGCLSEALGMRGNPTPVIPTITNPTVSQSNNPEIATPTTVPTPTLEPTPTEIPTPTLEPTFTPDIEATVQASIQQILGSQTPSPSTTPIPTPLPTLKYRPVEPRQSLGIDQFKFTTDPIRGPLTIDFTAQITGTEYEPTQIQVFQALRFEDYGGACSTEKPIALVLKSGGFGSVYYPWNYCPYPGSTPIPCGNTQKKCSTTNPDASVPFIKAKVWDYNREACTPPIPRAGDRNPPPCTPLNTWTWKVQINLEDNRVRDRMYNSPAGYIMVLFSGDTILSRTWVDWDD